MDQAERVLVDLAATTRFHDVRWVAEIPSTNEALAERARSGGGEGSVLVAGLQTAGRGRLGRRWEAPAGTALMASVLLTPVALGIERLHLLSAVVGLAAADACERLAGVRPDLKWPNDLLLGPAKLAGVLAELVRPAQGAAPPVVVVGIGLNVSASPPGAADLGGAAAPLTLLAALLEGIEARYGRWDALADEYAARCATVGRQVRVEGADGAFRVGTATGVDAVGRLVVEFGPGGSEALAAADVTHLRPADGDHW